MGQAARKIDIAHERHYEVYRGFPVGRTIEQGNYDADLNRADSATGSSIPLHRGPAIVKGNEDKPFWSVTVYDTETHSQIQTTQNKAALRSLFELKDVSEAFAVLQFGPVAPRGKEGTWIQTTPGRGWFAYFRIYGPEKSAFEGSWKPGDFTRSA